METDRTYYDENTKIIYGSPETYVPDPKGLGHAYYTISSRHRKKIAQLNMDTGESETYGSLMKRCIRTAIEMNNRGIVAGDIICICSVNNMHNYIPFISAQLVGAIVASLDPTISLVDTIHMIKQVNPKMVFVSKNSEELLENALRETEIDAEIVVFGDTDGHTSFNVFVEAKDNENDFEPWVVESNEQIALILFSSGTTGLSKGICISHYSLFYQAHCFASCGYDLTLMLGFASTYWISTAIMINVNQIFSHCRCLCLQLDAKEIWYQIEKFKITYIFMAPSQALRMLKVERPDGIDTTSLKDIVIGGGPLSPFNNLELRDLLPGTNIQLIYGQSEAAGIVTSFRPCNHKDVLLFHHKPASSGKPMPGYKYKIVDPETDEPLDLNEPGELRYTSKCQMIGYHNRDSSEALDEDGWIKTGDIGYFDEDLCIFIADRIKEMLKFQGFHVQPAKIEAILLSRKDVSIAIVIGIPNEEDGDHPMGLVILQESSNATEDELVEFVSERVDDRNRLRAGVKIIKIEDVPYTASGKIKKNVLRTKILNGEL